jgi:putative methyltransferase (TIGR04325 family)
MKQLIKDLIPPLIWRGLRQAKFNLINKQDSLEWEYIPEGWKAADKNPKIKGWNVESVLEAYKANWSKFLQNLEGTLPFGISPESDSEERTNIAFQNIIMTYAYALSTASRNKESLSILDWGGGIGHYYLISQKLIPNLPIDYSCKDVPILAEYGQCLFPEARFYSNDDYLENQYDLVIASSSLQYDRDWKVTLGKLAHSTKKYLFINRLPTVDKHDSFVIIQRPYQYGYNTEYLGWCLNRHELISIAASLELKLIRQFINQESPVVHNAPEQVQYYGFLFSR